MRWCENMRCAPTALPCADRETADRKSTRLNSSHVAISYAGFCFKKKYWQKCYYQLSLEHSGSHAHVLSDALPDGCRYDSRLVTTYLLRIGHYHFYNQLMD